VVSKVIAARGLVIKHVDAIELHIPVAAELAVAAGAMLVAQHLLKLGAHLVTALARLHVLYLARRRSLEAGSTWEKKGGEERRNVQIQVVVWHGKQEMPVARSRVSRTGKISDFTTLTSRAFGAAQSTLGVGGCGQGIFASATCSLQFAKASVSKLS